MKSFKNDKNFLKYMFKIKNSNEKNNKRNKNKKAQYSVEYLMVTGLTFLILIPALFLFYQFSNSQSVEIEQNQILRLGSRMTIYAQEAYTQGLDTKLTLQEQFPSILKNITFYNYPDGNGGEFVFHLYPRYFPDEDISIGFYSPYNVSIDAENIIWGPGLRNIIFKTLEDSNGLLYVNVSIE